jgi:hypothetical protein
LPIWGRVLILLWRAGHFLPQIVHTNSPTAPIWNIFNGVEFLLEKIIIATKMKETAEWLVFYEDLSHFPMEITLGFTCIMCA